VAAPVALRVTVQVPAWAPEVAVVQLLALKVAPAAGALKAKPTGALLLRLPWASWARTVRV